MAHNYLKANLFLYGECYEKVSMSLETQVVCVVCLSYVKALERFVYMFELAL